MIVGKINAVSEQLPVFMALFQRGLHKLFPCMDPQFFCLAPGIIGLAIVGQQVLYFIKFKLNIGRSGEKFHNSGVKPGLFLSEQR